MAKRRKQAPGWRVPDELWKRAEPLLPRYRRSKRGGRPRTAQRRVLDGILYVLRTGCQWKAAPREFGSASTLHQYFQEWTEKGGSPGVRRAARDRLGLAEPAPCSRTSPSRIGNRSSTAWMALFTKREKFFPFSDFQHKHNPVISMAWAGNAPRTENCVLSRRTSTYCLHRLKYK